MDQPAFLEIAPPRYERAPEFLVAGLWGRYTMKSLAGIPAQWSRLTTVLPSVPEIDPGDCLYGISWNCDDSGNFEYLSGVKVPDFSEVPSWMQTVRVPEHEYAVFAHSGHISEIGAVYLAIFNDWTPASGYKLDRSRHFERYGPAFNGATGEGGFEIWMPVSR